MPRYSMSGRALTLHNSTALFIDGVTNFTVTQSLSTPFLHYSAHFISSSSLIPLLFFLTISHLPLPSLIFSFNSVPLSPFISLLLSSPVTICPISHLISTSLQLPLSSPSPHPIPHSPASLLTPLSSLLSTPPSPLSPPLY